MTRITAKQARELNLLPGPAAKPKQKQKQKQLTKPKQKQTKAPAPKETEIQAQIRDYLRWHGWFVFKNHQSLGSYPGVADLYALRAGRSVWIEVKTPSGSQSDDQIQFEYYIKTHGGEYIVARRLEDVEFLVIGIPEKR